METPLKRLGGVFLEDNAISWLFHYRCKSVYAKINFV
jgi:hypothetical protein